MPLCSVRLLAPSRKHNLCNETSVSHWTISASIHCRFSINSIISRCLHSFPFSLSWIKFLVADWIVFFLLSYFSSSFPYLFFSRMRPLSKVETRGGSIPFWTLHLSSFCVCAVFVFSAALPNFSTGPSPWSSRMAVLFYFWLIKCTMFAFVVVVFELLQ